MAVMDTTGFLSAKVTAVYDRKLLERVTANQIFDKFGQAKTIPANSNAKTAFAYRYKNILPATTPLAEYNGSNIKVPNKIVREEITYSVGHYGDYITYSDELDLYDFDNIQSSFLDILGDQASLTVDTIRRDVLRGGTNVVYADGATSRLTVADGAKKHTANDFKIMAVKLKNQRAKKFKKVISGTTSIGTQPVRSAYCGIISPEVTEDLRGLAGWKNVEEYSDYSKAVEDEVGVIGDFRCMESFNNDPIPDQGTGTDTNVYISYFMGMDAYATVTLRGKNGIMTKVKPLGSGGTSDPLDQFGTIGWKAITGCAILNEAWLIRTECTASIEDSAVKDYYDYS
ncbi:MAG: N4-gp56 family major capsid protein [Helicobacteraceae bacterium]|nr:N4-gp56 family major capsid protein [Helicobacteraceae bacterium]